jgi:hypothetical protein
MKIKHALTISMLLLISTNLFSQITFFNYNKINIFNSNFIKNNTKKLTIFDKNFYFKSDFNEDNFVEQSKNSLILNQNFASDYITSKYDGIEDDKSFNIKQSDNDSDKYVPSSLFMYADNPRYTMTGDRPLLKTDIKPLNAALIGSFYAGVFYVQHEMQQSTIWKRVGPFNIQEDIKYCLWVDKFGHFYGGYSTSYLMSEALQTSGFSWETATIIGSALGLGYMTYIEILDGFSKDFGFSPSDFYADVLGSSYFLLQHYFPILQNFSPKFEYVNPHWLGEEKRRPHDTFIDDYSSQSFWWTINLQNLFGGFVKEYMPSWMQLTIGYAAYSMVDPIAYPSDPHKIDPVSHDVWGNRRAILAIDYDLVKLLPDGPPFWNWLKQGLNLFKLPSPALEFGFGRPTKFYILYPFEFRFSGFRM